MPVCFANQKKRASKRNKLRHTINEVCSKQDDEHDWCKAHANRKQHRGKKKKSEGQKTSVWETDEGEVSSSTSSSLSSSSSSSSSSDDSSDNERTMVIRAKKGKKRKI